MVSVQRNVTDSLWDAPGSYAAPAGFQPPAARFLADGQASIVTTALSNT